MQFNLTNEQKLRMLNEAKNTAHSELYLLLVKIGVNPDTFNLTDEIETDIKFAGEKIRIQGLVASLQTIEVKIQELQ